MKTAKEILEYREKSLSGTLGIYYNNNLLKSTITMIGLLKKALRDNSPVCMYTDCLSILGLEFEGEVMRVKDSITDDNPEWKDLNPSKELRDTFTEYVRKKPRSIRIIVRDPQKVPLPIREILEEYGVGLYILISDLGLDYFTVTRGAYQIENSDSVGSTNGSFMDPPNAQMLEDLFNQELIKRSTRINYE